MSGEQLFGLAIGGLVVVDVVALIAFGVWALWYTVARRPQGAPVLWWRHRASATRPVPMCGRGERRTRALWDPE